MSYMHELRDAAWDVIKAADCGEYFACPDSEDGWSDDDNLKPGKPWCPWTVRPGKCQPECAMMILQDLLIDGPLDDEG